MMSENGMEASPARQDVPPDQRIAGVRAGLQHHGRKDPHRSHAAEQPGELASLFRVGGDDHNGGDRGDPEHPPHSVLRPRATTPASTPAAKLPGGCSRVELIMWSAATRG